MKISSKISLVLIIGAILIILVVGVVINIFSSYDLRRINENIIATLNDSQAHEVSTFLESKMETSEILAAASVYRDFLVEPINSNQYLILKNKIYDRFNRTLEIDKNILELYILDKSGIVVASSDEEETGRDKSKDSYFTNALKQSYIKNPYFYEDYNEVVYTVSSPIADGDKILGVSVLIFSQEDFNKVVRPLIEGTKTGENFLVNGNYFLISNGRFLTKGDVLNIKIDTQNVKDCFLPDEKSKDARGILKNNLGNYIDYRGISIVGTHHYIPETGWCLITKQDTSEVLWPSFYLTIIIILVSLVVLGIFIPASYYATSKITKSIKRLQNEVKKIGKGELDGGVIINTGDEIQELSIAFDRMVDDVKKSREEIDIKVKEQTIEILEKESYLEDQQKATLNILEDVEEEKIKLNALLAGIGEGVIATDSAMNVIFMNKAAEDALGWSFVGVVGKNLYEFLKMYDEKGRPILEEKRPFSIALSTGKNITGSINQNYFYEKRNGEKLPVSISITPIKVDEKLIGAINVFRDITHDKEIDKAKTEFVSLASHQLRTPLSAINWYTEMLLAGDAGKISIEQKQYLEEVYRSNKRMVDLVNSLLNVSRIDLGTFAIVPEPTDIAEVSKSILKELTPLITTKKMNIVESYDKKMPKINVDAKLIRIIFQNLLSNAIKYTPDAGKVSVSIAKDDKNALIKIQDTGYGIPKKDQPRMFEKLFRADNVREKETDGTGLGMYIVKSILEQSGGKITFESEENKGTTFFVTIPLSGMKAKEGAKDLS